MKITLEDVTIKLTNTSRDLYLQQSGVEVGRLNESAVGMASEESGADFLIAAGEISRSFEWKTIPVRGARNRVKINPYEYCAVYNPAIKQVIFNDPATIVIWDTGEKTVVKCQNGEKFDPEKGVALCFMKYSLGNKGNYNDALKSAVANGEAETNKKK